MSNYKIIYSEEILDQFIDWLPETTEQEVYYLQLFGRKKYLADGTIQSGHNSLARFVCKRHEIKNRIQRLEVPIGTYLNREVPLPNECLAMYICPNPRSQEKAAKQLLKKLADAVTKPYEGYNVHQLALTELHKAISRKVYMDFDYDDMEPEQVLSQLEGKINIDAVNFLKTRGGFHLLVNIGQVSQVYNKGWYNNMINLGADCRGADDLIPISGTLQGGFEVPMIEKV